MPSSPYAPVLRNRAAVTVLLLGVLVRTPIAGVGPLLTMHVVLGLGHSYRDAGVVVMVNTLAAAVSGPWRGRLVDRQGLRSTLVTSIVVTAICWCVAPFAGYRWLVVLGGVAGLLGAPVWSMIRQGLMAAVPAGDRRTALSLDSVSTEIAFMVGPLASLWLAAACPTRYVLFGFQMFGVLTLVALWLCDPPMVSEDTAGPAEPVSRRSWLTPAFVAVCVVALASNVVLLSGDLGITAAMLGWGRRSLVGLVYVCWCGGSIVGALVYGSLHRHVSPFLMLGGLALLTAPMGLAPSWGALAALAVLAGLFCAPTLTATVEAVSELVPERARGEAMGWHGSMLTIGGAAGAPATGWFIDHWGARGGILAGCAFGVLVAVLGAAAVGRRRRARAWV